MHSNGKPVKRWLPDHLLTPMELDDPRPLEVKVSIAGEWYVLREADETANIDYRNVYQKAVQFGDEGGKTVVVGNDGTAEARSLILSKCLFKVDPNDTDEMEPVPLEVIRGWVPRIVKQLFDRLEAISLLKEDEETEEALEEQKATVEKKLYKLREDRTDAKNLQGAGTAT